MDNCGGHELDISLPGLRIESLPLRITAKYQPLDLGLFAHSKIRYRSLLLRFTIDVMLRKNANETEVPDYSQKRIFGLRYGFLPTVEDAMQLFGEAWSQKSRMTVIKCWIKSQ